MICEINGKLFVAYRDGVIVVHPDYTVEFIRNSFYD